MIDLFAQRTAGTRAAMFRELLADASITSCPSPIPPPSTHPAPAPKLLTARDAAKALAVCEKTLWAITDRGEIPVVRIGRSVRYDPQDLSRWIESRKSVGV
jgi:excisionase family DNA binding protein